MARISVSVLALLALFALAAQGCWLDGGPCENNSDCCIGLRCRSGECYWDPRDGLMLQESAQKKAPEEAKSAFSESGSVIGSTKDVEDKDSEAGKTSCIVFNNPVNSWTDCQRLCNQYGFGFFEYNGFNKKCTCC